VRVGKIGGYVPKSRNLDEIYMEDELSKKLYSTVFEHDEDVKVTGAGSNISCMSKWTDIPLNSKILVNIERSGYIHPRKIQAYTIPLIFDGYDLKAQAETGSGESLKVPFI
jgi:superfamily II DNA/RNA helicase